jgi:hypothetical protein
LLVGVVDVAVGLDFALWIKHERITASTVCWGDAVGNNVVDVLDPVVAGDRDDAVPQLDNADAVANRPMGDTGAAVVGDELPTAAVEVCRPKIVVVGSRQCHAEAKTPGE